ncbi:hypothetical protein NPIL_482941 [Nephila pilipes]|uniref:Uncharacterized protein n=1 Tax=Nephila pilipes TaxID=299642 RepID=A0A8X6UGG0_NEPPI|nr:hypothetical protein NPIL_482941 [Nephila pilipes]
MFGKDFQEPAFWRQENKFREKTGDKNVTCNPDTGKICYVMKTATSDKSRPIVHPRCFQEDKKCLIEQHVYPLHMFDKQISKNSGKNSDKKLLVQQKLPFSGKKHVLSAKKNKIEIFPITMSEKNN